ncbi:hypothetical protein KY289_008139 [Solanum tuberosum]|nr:hypothetical protein KY289_008139 [Solanum tuberosum]
MHRFWGVEQKIKYENFKTRPIVPGRVVNLNQLKDSNCPVSTYLKVQKLYVLFTLCGLEFFEELVRLFYVNLRISSDSGELETLVLGNRIIVNDLLFEDVFGTKFSSVISYMNRIWLDEFEVSLEGAKRAVAKPDSDLSDFGPLSLYFEHRILAHIVAISLIPRKGYLSNIFTHDEFVLYCLLRKYRINWAEWLKEYMWESVEDPHPSANLPYGLLISRIIVDRLLDLSMFTPVCINATYDSRTFSSMGYVQVENKWVKKDSVKARAETSKSTKISADLAALLMHDNDELNTRLLGVERKLRIAMTGIKNEGIYTVNKLIRHVDSLKGGVSSFNNDLAVLVQTFCSSLSRGVERSYNTFRGKVINTLKYFLSDR